MKIYLPAGAWIGNINSFLKSLDTSNDNELTITSHEKWVSLHPLVLCMIVALALKLKNKNKLHFIKMEAKSRHYLERMGIFSLLELDSEMHIKKHEELDFDSFLDMIREVYSKKIKELNKERYKKPKFI